MSKRPRKAKVIDTYFEDILFNLSRQDVQLRQRNGIFEIQWLKNGKNSKLDDIKRNGDVTLAEGHTARKSSSEWGDVCEVLQCVIDPKIDLRSASPDSQVEHLRDCGLTAVVDMKISISNYTMKIEINDAIARVDIAVEDIQYVPREDTHTSCAVTPSNCKYQLASIEIRSIRNFKYGHVEFWRLMCKKFGVPVDSVARDAFEEYLYRFQRDLHDHKEARKEQDRVNSVESGTVESKQE